MLLSASIARSRPLFGLGDGLGDDLRIAAEPLGLLDELATLDLEDLDKSATFMVRRGDLERRGPTTKPEIFFHPQPPLLPSPASPLPPLCFVPSSHRPP